LVDILVVLFLLIIGGVLVAPHFNVLRKQSPAIVCAGVQAACLPPTFLPEAVPPFPHRDEEAKSWQLIASFRGVEPDSMCIVQYEVTSPSFWDCDPETLDVDKLKQYGTCSDEDLVILERKARLAFGSCEEGVSQFVQAARCESIYWALGAVPDAALDVPPYAYY